MKKPIIYIYTFSQEVDLTAKTLAKLGYEIALPYNCEWSFEGTISIPKQHIEKRGIIRGGLKYLNQHYKGKNVILAEEYVTAEDILSVHDAMTTEPDALVLAERENPSGDGRFEKTAYSIIRTLFTIVQGRAVHDMHSGVRGIPGKYLPVFYNMKGSDRDFLLGQIMALRRLNIKLVQCKAITQGESSAAHTVGGLLKDIFRVAMLFVKFVSSSLASAFVDLGVYTLMLNLVTDSLLISSATARAVSSLFNFTVNQSVVFKQYNPESKWVSMLKYYALVVILWSIDYAGLLLLVKALGIDRILAKVIIGVFVYAISFTMQRDYVFKNKKEKNKLPG